MWGKVKTMLLTILKWVGFGLMVILPVLWGLYERRKRLQAEAKALVLVNEAKRHEAAQIKIDQAAVAHDGAVAAIDQKYVETIQAIDKKIEEVKTSITTESAASDINDMVNKGLL